MTPARAIADAGARLRFIITSHAQLVTRGQGSITILVDEITALAPAQNRKITHRKREYFEHLRGVLNQLKRMEAARCGSDDRRFQSHRHDQLALALVQSGRQTHAGAGLGRDRQDRAAWVIAP